MTNKEIDYGTYAANWAQLVADNISFIVPPNNYSVMNDKRLLIPFMKNQKIGFVNHEAEPIVEPKYDIICGEVYDKSDFVKVGIRYSYGYLFGNEDIRTSIQCKYGLLDYSGKVVFEPLYVSISISDDRRLFTLREKEKGYCVVKVDGEIIVPYGEFDFIDGFTKGYARVKHNNKWGIIDVNGKIILPVDYENIWCFYGKQQLESTKVIKNGKENSFYLVPLKRMSLANIQKREYNEYEYGKKYGEYAGTYAQDIAGYSDDVINDAFDGLPDAYWNID